MDSLENLARKPTTLATEALASSVANADLERLLQFLNEVNDVLVKSFQPVLSALEGVLRLSSSDIGTPAHHRLVEELGHMQELNYYNVRLVCNRLHGLRDHFDKHIRALVQPLPNASEWLDLFWILDEREGYIQREVTTLIGGLTNDLRQVTAPADLQRVDRSAADAIRQVRAALDDMSSYAVMIQKHSDRIGFLALTDLNRARLAEDVRQVVNNDNRVTVNAAGANVSGALVVGNANRVTVKSSGGDPAVSALLERLKAELDKAARAASPETAAEMKQDFKTLQSEVSKASPRHEWYELSSKGLIAAAATVGAIGAPVIETVKAIMGLLGP